MKETAQEESEVEEQKLAVRKSRAEAAKLELENKKMERDLSPWLYAARIILTAVGLCWAGSQVFFHVWKIRENVIADKLELKEIEVDRKNKEIETQKSEFKIQNQFYQKEIQELNRKRDIFWRLGNYYMDQEIMLKQLIDANSAFLSELIRRYKELDIVNDSNYLTNINTMSNRLLKFQIEIENSMKKSEKLRYELNKDVVLLAKFLKENHLQGIRIRINYNPAQHRMANKFEKILTDAGAKVRIIEIESQQSSNKKKKPAIRYSLNSEKKAAEQVQRLISTSINLPIHFESREDSERKDGIVINLVID